MTWQRSIEFERRAQQAESLAKSRLATIETIEDVARRSRTVTDARTVRIATVDSTHPVAPENHPNIAVRDSQIVDLTFQRDTLTVALGIAKLTIADLQGTLASRPKIILTPPALSLKPQLGLGLNLSMGLDAKPELRVGINLNFVSWRPL